jgi:preprotein translocase subunit SecD
LVNYLVDCFSQVFNHPCRLALERHDIPPQAATLEFRLVNTNVDQSAAASGRVPGDSEVKQTREGQPVVMYKRVILTGDHITDSTSSQDEYNQPRQWLT